MSKDFGERLKRALKEAGYSQKSASEALGLSKNAMTNYVGGRIPEATILYRIAKLCSVTMEWLLTGEGERETVKTQATRKEASGYAGADLTPGEIEFIAKVRQLTRDNRIKVEGIVEGLLLGQGSETCQQDGTVTSSRSMSGNGREEAAAISETA
ncbi:helix-turn-helix transcriptional regulator [Brevibacillus composti]|uniref:Helix-turn-helix transcriptional regulator n=1 Tax=Brevibacillus composti TaxID=2796470 RepID=A0ABX7Z9J8_9BACL|nr:helix-turn-helix transcriptional regulator [Brevibacillus composti]QUO43424.1 helix-turn-helix transcriptional regulator [Brevibacillus composti]